MPTKIGILYTTSEANSLSTIEEYKELADDYGFEIVESGINTIADVEMAAKDLAGKGRLHQQPDRQYRSICACRPLLQQLATAGIPVFGSEVEQVKNGCLASMRN